MNRLALAVAPLSLFLAAGSLADVFPTQAPTAGGNTIPFSLPTVHHQVFASTLFSNATGGQSALITRISLAPLNSIRYKCGLIVRLGYTSNLPGGLQAPSSGTGGGGAPNATVPPGMTDFFIAPTFLGNFTNASPTNFQMVLDGTPFVYDPTRGNLLVEFVVTSPSHTALQISTANGGAESSRSYNIGTTTGTSPTVAIRMDFAFSAHNEAATGACCAADSSCITTTEPDCNAQGRIYRGDNLDCGTSPCPQPGACCQLDGTCTIAQPSACVANAGVFYGQGVVCGTYPCAQTGACCDSSGGCTNILEADCTALGSSWKPTPCGVAVCSKALISPIPSCQFPVICNSSAAATAVNASLYMDFTASPTSNLAIRRIDFNSNAAAGTPTEITLWVRDGTYVGFDGSTTGWRTLGVFNVQSTGTLSTNPPVHIDLPTPLFVQQGRTVSVCLVAASGGLRYRTSAANVSDSDLTFLSAVSRTPAFTGASVTRGLTGCIIYDPVALSASGACCSSSGSCSLATLQDCVAGGGLFRGAGSDCTSANCPPGVCYANCDASSVNPILNANDFQCFLNKFAAADAYANCDGSSVAPILNANDFQCFLNAFAAGCS